MINYLCLRFKQTAQTKQYVQFSSQWCFWKHSAWQAMLMAPASHYRLRSNDLGTGQPSLRGLHSIGTGNLGALRRNVCISISIKRTQNSLICLVPWCTRKFGLQEQYVVTNKQSPISQYFLIVPVIQVLISLVRLVNRYQCFTGLTVFRILGKKTCPTTGSSVPFTLP